MPRAKKPKITTRCPAAAHDPPTRRTAELCWPDVPAGCLMQLSSITTEAGRSLAVVDLYSVDHYVMVRCNLNLVQCGSKLGHTVFAELAQQQRKLDEAQGKAKALASALRTSEQERHRQAATIADQQRAVLQLEQQQGQQRALLQLALQALSTLAGLGGDESMESQDSAWRAAHDVQVQLAAQLNPGTSAWAEEQQPTGAEQPDDLPCERESAGTDAEGRDEWWCVNDHTGCAWNDGQNGCMHEGTSLAPLEEE